MTTIVINPKGTARYNEFSRVEEYAFFVFIGDIRFQSFGNDMLTERDYSSETHVRWRGLARTGRKGLRSNNPGSWYPIFLNESDFSIHSIGDAIGKDEDESNVDVPIGTIAIWPSTKDGQQYSWSTVPETLRSIYLKGGFKTGRIDHKKRSYPFCYLSSGSFDKISKGEILVTGRGPSNELIVEFAEGLKSAAPRSVWNKVTHDAGSHGTGLLQQIIPGGKFPFPKSLYAVKDAIRFFISSKPNALVVDFFAGSGTTLNAVNLLNTADNGNRRCILVTNNEVSAEEAKNLQEQGLMPGDAEYEKHGICQSVTYPRCKYTILGKRDDGTLLDGDYLTPPASE
jgi:adenine-specific DNA-methyltransferase